VNTLQKLEAYKKALEKWKRQKDNYDANVANGKKPRHEIEPEPMPIKFEIKDSEIEWAEKIRRKIMTPIPPMPTLDNQLPKKIKLPTRTI